MELVIPMDVYTVLINLGRHGTWLCEFDTPFVWIEGWGGRVRGCVWYDYGTGWVGVYVGMYLGRYIVRELWKDVGMVTDALVLEGTVSSGVCMGCILSFRASERAGWLACGWRVPWCWARCVYVDTLPLGGRGGYLESSSSMALIRLSLPTYLRPSKI